MIGDIIVAVNSDAVSSPGDLQKVLDPERVGSSVTVRVVRAGNVSDAKITIGRRDGGQ
jgi:S1-C subfamily serine protease